MLLIIFTIGKNLKITMENKIFLVTGGLGFIGKHFIDKCLYEGHNVINIARLCNQLKTYIYIYICELKARICKI
jgi:nucleoside-diphosphate-sugar epimerase